MEEVSSKKEIFEYVVVMSKGEDQYLTENQYNYYTQNRRGTVVFRHCEINPSFVVSVTRRPAEMLLKMYPCKQCLATGKAMGEICKDCDGTGVYLK